MPSGLRNNLIFAAVLVVSWAAQRNAPFAHAIVATAPANTSQDRPLAAIVFVNIKPDIHQGLRAVADIDALEMLTKIPPLHPEKTVIYHQPSVQQLGNAVLDKTTTSLYTHNSYLSPLHLCTFPSPFCVDPIEPTRRTSHLSIRTGPMDCAAYNVQSMLISIARSCHHHQRCNAPRRITMRVHAP